MAYGYEIFLRDGVSGIASSIARNYSFMSNRITGLNDTINQSVSHIGESFSKVFQDIGLDLSSLVDGFAQVRDASIEAFADIEKKQTILKTSFGSSIASDAILADLEKFATQYNVDIKKTEDAYINLANRGFVATMDQFLNLNDITAKFKGKTVDMLAEALLDAELGSFERLNEFGMKMSQNKKGGIDAVHNGVVTQIGSSSKEIRKYLLDIGSMEGTKGMTAAIAKTAAGGAIGAANQYEILYRAIGAIATPLSDVFGSMAEPLLHKITNLVKDNKEELLKMGSSFMYVGIRVMAVYGTFKILHGGIVIFNVLKLGIIGFYGRLQAAWSWILLNNMALQNMGASGLRALFSMIVGVGSYIASVLSATAAQLGLNIMLSANPIGLFILGVVALSAAFYGLYKFVDAMFPNLFKTLTSGFKAAFDFIYNWFIKPVMDFFSWLFESAMPKLPEVAGAEGDKFSEWKYRSGESGGSVYDFLNPDSLKVAKKDEDKHKKKKDISDKIESSGHGGIKNITINIGKLIESMHFHTSNMTENATMIKAQVERILLDAVNQVNYQ